MLDATFHYIEGHQYEGMDLKPYLRNDAQYLDPDQVKQERSAKAAIFASVKEVREKLGFLRRCRKHCWNDTQFDLDAVCR